jgi:hypothetical protein
MLAPGVKARETAERETPARSATSWALTKRRSPLDFLSPTLLPQTTLDPSTEALHNRVAQLCN